MTQAEWNEVAQLARIVARAAGSVEAFADDRDMADLRLEVGCLFEAADRIRELLALESAKGGAQ